VVPLRLGAAPDPFVPTWNIVEARVVAHQVRFLADRATVVALRFSPSSSASG
jgi:hypothetical protein